jgi:hypothetical protein
MKEIGRVYELPISREQSGMTARARLFAALKRRGYFPDTDKDFIGSIYSSYHKDRKVGEIRHSDILTTKSPELEELLRGLDITQIPKNQTERGD